MTIVPPSEDKTAARQGDKKKKVAVLMSGGVDSSVAALLLLRQGFDAVGVTMDLLGGGNRAAESAAEVCRALEIPLFLIGLTEEFRELVVGPFCAAYALGETPNPCAACNELVKFGLAIDLLAQAWEGGFDIATGHYAKIVREYGLAFLARAEHRKKDQSYFLSGIRKELLTRLHFPLGELTGKDETRKIARDAKLPVAERPESMEICFAGEGNYRKIIGSGEPGAIIDTSGKIAGRHGGLRGYTLGQRKGLGIASRQPLFVVGMRTGDNTLIVAPRQEAFEKNVAARNLNIMIEHELGEGAALYGKIRSQGEPAACVIKSLGAETVTVEFAEPVFAPAPGQRLVLYTSNGKVAAGGVITRGKS